eukprot:CAMPEP_0203679920 /NCGR_PEP_ID=MMETSP0090-20130426/37487_1 /ASSEMBLY_ACC=CAM_ASM_001088 /TAXON_ID=426623 /ORGANISM="Chaetoceros affinis, Strain CCMP159" /LENGTH=118 /DNA_ID=CAMNT_0050547759 /DNA_START=26 /DNA_END=379 /DNA_ORIENTATION=+
MTRRSRREPERFSFGNDSSGGGNGSHKSEQQTSKSRRQSWKDELKSSSKSSKGEHKDQGLNENDNMADLQMGKYGSDELGSDLALGSQKNNGKDTESNLGSDDDSSSSSSDDSDDSDS